jgi:hypothetical protein
LHDIERGSGCESIKLTSVALAGLSKVDVAKQIRDEFKHVAYAP